MISPAVRRKAFFRQVFSRGTAEGEAAPAALREELAARCEAAFRTGEVDAFLDLAERLRGDGALSRGDARRYAQKLVDLDRCADALSVLLDDRYQTAGKAPYLRVLAWALAGAGQLEPARDALTKAEALEPASSDAGFAQALALALGQRPEPDWQTAVRVAEARLALGLAERAGAGLMNAFGRLASGGEDDVLDVLRLGQEILKLADPGLAEQFGAALLAWTDGSDALRHHPGRDLCRALALSREGRDAEAAPLLAPLAAHLSDEEFKGAESARLDLANTIGRLVISETRPRFVAGERRKVVDMFPMNDELLMLRIKLEEMQSWVDHFVIVESRFTFQGDRKTLHFERAKGEFAEFLHKIVHVVVDELPAWAATTWTREFHQRDCGLRGLDGLCGEDDFVLVTDVDEIVDRRAIERLEAPFASLGMPTYNYFFNLEAVEDRQKRWAAVLKARYLRRIGPSFAKIGIPQYAKAYDMADAGWHFSGVRDVEGLVSKFNSFSNTHRSGLGHGHFEDEIARIRAAGGAAGYVRRELDERFPQFIRTHRAELDHLIL